MRVCATTHRRQPRRSGDKTVRRRRRSRLNLRPWCAQPWDRGLATPWTQLSPFIPVFCRHGESCPRPAMLSIQAVRGLPRLRAPGTVPCSDTTCRQMASVDSGFTCTVLSPDWGCRVQAGPFNTCVQLYHPRTSRLRRHCLHVVVTQTRIRGRLKKRTEQICCCVMLSVASSSRRRRALSLDESIVQGCRVCWPIHVPCRSAPFCEVICVASVWFHEPAQICPQRHLDRFSRFCRTHRCAQRIDHTACE